MRFWCVASALPAAGLRLADGTLCERPSAPRFLNMSLTSYFGDSIVPPKDGEFAFHDEFVPEFRNLPNRQQEEAHGQSADCWSASGCNWGGCRWIR